MVGLCLAAAEGSDRTLGSRLGRVPAQLQGRKSAQPPWGALGQNLSKSTLSAVANDHARLVAENSSSLSSRSPEAGRPRWRRGQVWPRPRAPTDRLLSPSFWWPPTVFGVTLACGRLAPRPALVLTWPSLCVSLLTRTPVLLDTGPPTPCSVTSTLRVSYAATPLVPHKVTCPGSGGSDSNTGVFRGHSPPHETLFSLSFRIME